MTIESTLAKTLSVPEDYKYNKIDEVRQRCFTMKQKQFNEFNPFNHYQMIETTL